MAKMTYAEQLAHPKWQRKRLDTLNAAGWKCANCAAGDVTLHVHHRRYIKGRMAWEYEEDELSVLCKDCHQSEHEIKEAAARVMQIRFAEDVLVEDFSFGFLTGMMAPFGEVTKEDVELAMENYPRFFALGYMVCSLGPSDIASAVRRKLDEGRFGPHTGMLRLLLDQEESEDA